jgi:hypothetical protein
VQVTCRPIEQELLLREPTAFYVMSAFSELVALPHGERAGLYADRGWRARVQANLGEVADEIERRLLRLFLRDANGRRPVYGESPLFQRDPAWRDRILFYEYFHGDTGEGLGASHQTGWTALVGALVANRRGRAHR